MPSSYQGCLSVVARSSPLLHPAARGAFQCFCQGEVVEMLAQYGWLIVPALLEGLSQTISHVVPKPMRVKSLIGIVYPSAAAQKHGGGASLFCGTGG